jgi:hypothetical protein
MRKPVAVLLIAALLLASCETPSVGTGALAGKVRQDDRAGWTEREASQASQAGEAPAKAAVAEEAPSRVGEALKKAALVVVAVPLVVLLVALSIALHDPTALRLLIDELD